MVSAKMQDGSEGGGGVATSSASPGSATIPLDPATSMIPNIYRAISQKDLPHISV